MCRAYLSNTQHDTEAFFVGRANIGAASLNLPMIWQKSVVEGKDFYKELIKYLEMIRNFLKKRYQTLSKTKASTNPLAFTQGGMKGGYLNPDQEIGELVKNYTASFGVTSLNELNMLMEGKPLHESNNPAIDKVVDFLEEYVSSIKKEDGHLYALYATPAESLCGTQLKQFREKYGVINGVSDKEYFSNGFHCHVSAEISPFTKQDKEYRNYHKINGGHIQYSRVDTSKPEVVKGIVLRALSLGYYTGVNANLTFCDCGWETNKTADVCGNCGSDELYEISRVSGYLGFSKQKGDTRFNDAKLSELHDRVSM